MGPILEWEDGHGSSNYFITQICLVERQNNKQKIAKQKCKKENLKLTSRDQRRRIHDPVDGPQVLRREALGHGQVHIRRPRVEDGVRPLLQVDGLFLLVGRLRVALEAQGGAKFAEREPVPDVAFEVAVDFEEFVYISSSAVSSF